MISQDEGHSDVAVCREQAIRLLARREHSRRELDRKLAARAFERPVIEQVLTALESEGLLSDTRFAEVYTRHRIESGYGILRIRSDLAERGVDSVIVDQAIDLGDDDWLWHCQQAWQRRFGVKPTNRREWARQARFLGYRGFPADLVRRVLGRIGAGNWGDDG